MATFNVSTIDDLIAKIKLANTNGQDDEIILAAGTYDISAYSGTRDNDFKSPSGVLTVTNGLPVIKTNIITRNGTIGYRLFHVAASATLTLRKLTLSKGNVGVQDVGGGAVEVLGTAVIEDCRLGPDNKSNYGGAIVNDGTVTIRRCDIFNNQADWGGGIYNYNQGVMRIYDSRIASNTNDGGLYYAGGVYNSNDLVIDHCCIVDNTANVGGGVMSNRATAQTTIRRSIISRNNAYEGAGVYSGSGPMNLEDCTLVDNTGSYGRVAYRKDVQAITLTRCHLPDNYITATDRRQSPSDLLNVVNQNPLPAWRPNFTMISDGAGGLTPAYQYNRQEAANRAIALSRENFITFPNSDAASVVGKIENGPISRGRDYATVLTHKPGKTGSSIFISDASLRRTSDDD
ncbi:MAG: right-handed parallel beta-helix repeat-containing protein [Chloroflexota bacterium]|nr:right-handed parallel beta-helix repeat-containing protein [Chloroflexota bacterium]